MDRTVFEGRLVFGLGVVLAAVLLLSGCGEEGSAQVAVPPCNGECPPAQCINDQCLGETDGGPDVEDDADEEDADVTPDAAEDVVEDTPDAPDMADVEDTSDEDADGGDADTGDTGRRPFSESCMYEALLCHGIEPEPVTCTIRPEPEPLVVDVTFEDPFLETRGTSTDRTYR